MSNKPKKLDMEEWGSKVAQWQSATHDIPRIVHEEIAKSRRLNDPAKRAAKTIVSDPFSIQYALGYKDRHYSITYDVLKRIPQQLSVVAAIIQTRCNQVGSFSQPYRNTKSIGYMIKHKDPSHQTTKSEMEFIQTLERMIYNCGRDKRNPYSSRSRDDFEAFLKMIVRDSLMYDQCTFEVVPDRRGLPYEFVPVDASTIRIASDEEDYKRMFGREQPPNFKEHPLGPYRTMTLNSDASDPAYDRPAYVQLVNGQIENVFTEAELAFGVRNPRTDIYIHRYGYGELEQLITIISSHLNAEEYNRRFFTQGSAPKGILNFKGDNITSDMLEAFQREWRANLEGVHNAWRTPILQSEGLDWIPLDKSNAEMEFNQWIEYLIKVACAVFLIDPSEINFDLHGGVQQTPLFEASQEWKLKASRDRGLKPLLRFIAKLVNKYIIEPIDDHFSFDFVGLDELTEQEKHELRKEEVGSFKTLNEVRRAEDLPDVEGGDVVLNPTYLQARQMQMQEDQMAQMQAQQGAQPPGGQPAGQQLQGQPEGDPAEQQANPQDEHQASLPAYADNFQKSLGNGKFLEIEFDDWIEIKRHSLY